MAATVACIEISVENAHNTEDSIQSLPDPWRDVKQALGDPQVLEDQDRLASRNVKHLEHKQHAVSFAFCDNPSPPPSQGSVTSFRSRDTSTSLGHALSHSPTQDSVHGTLPASQVPEHCWAEHHTRNSLASLANEARIHYCLGNPHCPTGSLVGSFNDGVGGYPQGHDSRQYSSFPAEWSVEAVGGEKREIVTNNDKMQRLALDDVESLCHKQWMKAMKTTSRTRTWVMRVSVLLTIGAIIAMTLLLTHSGGSKKMARASFMACTLVVECAVAAGMWATDRTMVEILIAMNIVLVSGIYLGTNIDALFADNAF